VTAFYDADGALDKIQRDIRLAQERAERATQVQGEIALVRGKARSRHGEVAAEVDASGVLTDLQLTDEALEQRPDDLAHSIRDVVREAQRDAGKRAMVIADDAFGAGSTVTAHLRAEFEQRLR